MKKNYKLPEGAIKILEFKNAPVSIIKKIEKVCLEYAKNHLDNPVLYATSGGNGNFLIYAIEKKDEKS